MNLIQQLLRAAVSGLIIAAVVAAGPASAEEQASKHRGPIADFGSCAKPVYPPDAIKNRRTGTVTLGFLIEKDGTVAESKVVKSSGHTDLDEAARDGITLCKFLPAVENGKHVKEWMQMQYVWVLD
jgi:bla regulator protein BlaR1